MFAVPKAKASAPKKEEPEPYSAPAWALAPSLPYSIEAIKNGTVIDTLTSDSFPTPKSYLLIGRLPNCDIFLEHQSVSRYHAVIQFKDAAAYLYDLKSTHGTYLSKKQIPPKQYVRIHNGELFRFGESSRSFIYTSAAPDPLPQIQEGAPSANPLSKSHPSTSEDGISWGFQPDDPSHPVDSSSDTPFYTINPISTLSQFFESMGEKLSFTTTFKGSKSEKLYLSKIAFVDGEDTWSGEGMANKKREAEELAAVELLKGLDSRGLLSGLEGESGKKRRKIESDDDDEYYDRTSTGKKSRESKIETEESLTIKLLDSETRVEELESEIGLLKSKSSVQTQEMDALDSFMKGLEEKEENDKVKTLEKQLEDLKTDIIRYKKLLAIATEGRPVTKNTFQKPTDPTTKSQPLNPTKLAQEPQIIQHSIPPSPSTPIEKPPSTPLQPPAKQKKKRKVVGPAQIPHKMGLQLRRKQQDDIVEYDDDDEEDDEEEGVKEREKAKLDEIEEWIAPDQISDQDEKLKRLKSLYGY